MEIIVFLSCLEKEHGRESSLLLRQVHFTKTSKWTMQPHKVCAALWRSQMQGTANQSWMEGAVSQSFELEQSSARFPFWQRQFFLIKLQYCRRAWGTGRTHGSSALLQQGRPAACWAVWGSRWGRWSFPSGLALVAVQLEPGVQTDSDRTEQSHRGAGNGEIVQEERSAQRVLQLPKVGPGSAQDAQGGSGVDLEALSRHVVELSPMEVTNREASQTLCVQPTLPIPCFGLQINSSPFWPKWLCGEISFF